MLVKVPQYLYKLAVNPNPTDTGQPNVFVIPSNPGNAQVNSLPLVLYPGAIVTSNGGANSLGIDDWTQLKACFDNASSCPTIVTPDNVHIPIADLDDDTKITIVDFNIFIRSIAQLLQVNGACNGLICQGE